MEPLHRQGEIKGLSLSDSSSENNSSKNNILLFGKKLDENIDEDDIRRENKILENIKKKQWKRFISYFH